MMNDRVGTINYLVGTIYDLEGMINDRVGTRYDLEGTIYYHIGTIYDRDGSQIKLVSIIRQVDLNPGNA
ncbi:MAG: hypothetical protein AB7T22_11595 [Calditrichaceae bacterium]